MTRQQQKKGAKNATSDSGSEKKSEAPSVRFIIKTPVQTSQKQDKKSVWAYTGGYLGMFGQLCDEPHLHSTYNSSEHESIVPDAHKEKQRQRDGNAYHMTLMLKKDVEACAKKVDDLFADTIKLIQEREGSKLPNKFQSDAKTRFMYVLSEVVLADDFEILGVGRVQQNNEEAYFRVIRWESANKFLEKFGLPRKDFHMTIAFKDKDIHNVSKNEHTLISKHSS